MTQTRGPATIGEMAGSIGDMLVRTGRSASSLAGAVQLPKMHRSGCDCGCQIPPPCWVPRTLDELDTRVCAGSKSVVRVTITNCGFTKRAISLKATGASVDIEPAAVSLDARERATIVLSMEVPASSPEGEERRAVVWVRGCRDYVLPWNVETSCTRADCCREVSIDDCPDLVHHWYDHFYCNRGCRHDA
jgi:hypothetical protein